MFSRKSSFIILFLIIFGAISGCANYYTKANFETDQSKIDSALNNVKSNERSTVYLYRARAFMQELVYIPIPPVYFAVNDVMSFVAPLGSYVILSLEPGTHKFTSIYMLDRKPLVKNVHLELKAGETYYVGVHTGFPEPTFSERDQSTGKRSISESKLARLIYQPVSTSTFLSRLSNSSSSVSAAANNSGTSNFQSLLPSEEQVKGFVEGLATVALVALLIFGAAAGASINMDGYRPPSNPLPSNNVPSISRPLGQNLGVANTLGGPREITINNSLSSFNNQSFADMIRSEQKLVIRNQDTGVRYEMENGQIRGNDGSRYRVIGSRVYGANGEEFHAVGDSIFTKDGRHCRKVLDRIQC